MVLLGLWPLLCPLHGVQPAQSASLWGPSARGCYGTGLGDTTLTSSNSTTCCFSFIRNLTAVVRKAYVVSHQDACCLVTRGWRQTFPRLSLQGAVMEQR